MRERNTDVQLVALCTSPIGNLACNPGMCPDWESNLQSFGLTDDAQYIEPHQSGPVIVFSRFTISVWFIFIICISLLIFLFVERLFCLFHSNLFLLFSLAI